MKKKRYTFKKLINDIHLWLGIGSGIILFIVCLTGTILTFEEEIGNLLEPEKFYVDVPETPPQPVESLIRSTEQSLGIKVTEVIILQPENKSWMISGIPVDQYEKARSEGGRMPRGSTWHVNPFTGEVLDEHSNGSVHEFFHIVMELHRWLLLDRSIGRPVVGVATIIFIVICLSGLILWWPKQVSRWRYWRKGLFIKFSGNWKRINYDLHNTLGFYSLILLLIMGFSGLIWSFTWYWKGMEALLGDQLGKSRFDAPMEMSYDGDKSARFPIEQLIGKTDELLPYVAYGHRITLPQSENQTLLMRKKPGSFFAVDGADKIQFNPFTGEVLTVEKFSDLPVTSQIANLIRSIHVGSVFGTFSKILYFVSCLVATSLPVTGTIVWINKLRKKSKSQHMLKEITRI